MHDLFSLDDPRARDPQVAGAKAAGLAGASACDLPVLPGVVVPAGVLAPAIAAGAGSLGRSLAAARLVVAGARLEPGIESAVRHACARFRDGAIVRSSSPLEYDPRWSGAFATYHEVGPSDLATALLGCAASVFSRDVIGRCDELGLEPGGMDLAVLVQPWLRFDGGGTARVDGEVVSVHGVLGDPARLASGRLQGSHADVGAAGEVDGDVTVGGLAADAAHEVAALMRRVHAELHDDSIEWGMAEGRLQLLQVRRAPVTHSRSATGFITRPAVTASAFERHLARLAERYPAPMGELLVVPWAAGLDTVPDASPIPVTDPASSLREIYSISASLREAAWRSTPGDAALRWADSARRLLAGVLGNAPPGGLDGLCPPDPARATRLIGLVRGLGDALTARGSLPHPEMTWRLDPADLELAASLPGYRPAVPHGADRWELFVAAVVEACGTARRGVAVSAGVGAGRAHRLVTGAGRPPPRAVLVVDRPVPQIAPLLWGCAGLVTAEGSEGAHLFEVARSLGVPAVTSLRLDEPDASAPGTLVAVDGDGGTVAVLEEEHDVSEVARAGA
ncbi:MAG: PEP-utilizing enzyme [Actinomycetota bacterium]